MKGARVTIPAIQFFLVTVLFEEENVGAQFREFKNIVCGALGESLALPGHLHPKSLLSVFNGSLEDDMTYPVNKDETEWKAELSPDRFHVLRQAGTERPWTGELLDEKRLGEFLCAGCGASLFRSDTKFDSGSGWPSFWDAANPDAIEVHEDRSLGMVREEIICANCGGHLGHRFPDGYGTPTGQRYCVNSLSLEFTPSDDASA